MRKPVSHSITNRLCALQAAMVVLAISLMAFAPPAEGRMIILPLSPGATTGLVNDLHSLDARPLDGGPLPGSVVVVANRADLFMNMLWTGRLVIAAPNAGCGRT
ncbi:hypothetical protein KCG44_02610 [Pacificimonas sp. WHA3]|uniref:Uncharacterized protein n=1 Tax=Pacificimonas pallii TaxID=2827236 RepID=A0ABS6SB82_9SPHN|nr:hypothetical protein [Pacificimonas pallii]MBV7255674.1 hypothetical protein [Pacificimonas pallii]